MRIYIDTSVINGLYADDAPWIRQKTEEFFVVSFKQGYSLYISDLVIAEIERTGDIKKRKQLHSVIEKEKFKQLSTTEEIESLAQLYLSHHIIPHKYLPDALYIALATINKIPVIVSWNFQHIVRHRTRIMVNKLNEKNGHPVVDICSPEEVD